MDKIKNILEKYWIGGSIGLAVGLFSFPAIILNRFFGITNQDILALIIFGTPTLGTIIGIFIEWLIRKILKGGRNP